MRHQHNNPSLTRLIFMLILFATQSDSQVSAIFVDDLQDAVHNVGSFLSDIGARVVRLSRVGSSSRSWLILLLMKIVTSSAT